ncbi:MAG: hypothetical protein H7308_09515 [Chthonomonadaceae bacterium]|nr:hypothetical protein [Chthonomonadaceae bacterium]
MNTINVIAPYKWNGMWVFDDESVGLLREAFVSGADTMLDEVTRHIPNAENGFRLTFAEVKFPGFMVQLEWSREDPDVGGNWYRWSGTELEGWLCPALFHYFEAAPKAIYVRAEPLPEGAKK